MNYLHLKYGGLVSSRLRNFKRRNDKYNFSCPICGDSDTRKHAARGWLYSFKDTTLYHCYKCSVTLPFEVFLRRLDEGLFLEYKKEKLLDGRAPVQNDMTRFVTKMKPPAFIGDGPLKGLKKVSQLAPEHPIKKYVDSRKIPPQHHCRLFSCPNFFRWTNGIVPGKFNEDSLAKDETRLLIPFINAAKSMHAFQGRSLRKDHPLKYITIVTDEDTPKVYGLDRVNWGKTVYALEGPIDSLFLENAISTAGGDLASTLNGFDKEKLVVVYDNERRSNSTIQKMQKAVDLGFKVCIWPDTIQEKDVNDMVMAGMSADHIKWVIDQNTHQNLRANLALKSWSKS